MYGSYNEHTGNKDHGSFYCKKCGWQVPVGFKHYHADELLKKLRENEEALKQLAEKTFAVQHSPNCPSPYLVRLAGRGKGMIDLKPPNRTADVLGYGKTLCEAAAAALEIQEKQKDPTPAFTDACE
jgi:hypothetical protein